MLTKNENISYTKKILKLILLLVSLFTFIIVVGMTSISTKYINKPVVTLDVNNVQNPLIKKLVRGIDNEYALFLLKIRDEQKKHLDQTDSKYQELPEECKTLMKECNPLSEIEKNRKEKQKITFDTWKKTK